MVIQSKNPNIQNKNLTLWLKKTLVELCNAKYNRNTGNIIKFHKGKLKLVCHSNKRNPHLQQSVLQTTRFTKHVQWRSVFYLKSQKNKKQSCLLSKVNSNEPGFILYIIHTLLPMLIYNHLQALPDDFKFNSFFLQSAICTTCH